MRGYRILSVPAALLAAMLVLPSAAQADEHADVHAGSGATADGAGSAEYGVIDVVDLAFAPADLTVVAGTEVTWRFLEDGHDTASTQGFWESELIGTGGSYERVFSAGTYPYVCTPHATFMTGVVRVAPERVAGSKAKGWRVRWGAGTGSTYDVQLKRQGGSWRWLARDTEARAKKVTPKKGGVYQLRARTTTGVDTSDWSPVLKLRVR